LAQIRLNLTVIGSAVEKTRKTVYALKSYTHVQHEEMMAPVDLADNLEVVLTMYHNQLKHGVTLRQHYDRTLPPVWGYADELNQVWTNLLHNGAQAMQYSGEIDIYIQRANDAEAVVRIEDNGPGVPPEIQQRIFEPFFTTKPQGEGSGLGLDICRKIIEKHGGRIELESRPGHTVFSVFLPFEPPQQLIDAAPTAAAESVSSAPPTAPTPEVQPDAPHLPVRLS
jgi:signal transduction histidine kinase